MTRTRWSALSCVALLAASPAIGQHDVAAQVPRPIDIGRPAGDTTARRCFSETDLTAALAAFNSPGAVHVSGTAEIPAGLIISGGYAVYRGLLRVDGTVRGDIVVLNGEVRVRSTGVVTGAITVIGGRATIDAGARVSGRVFQCDQPVSLTKLADNTIARSAPTPSFGNIRSALTADIGGFRFTPHLGLSQPNRVENIPIQIGANVVKRIGAMDSVRGELFGIVRTARDPSESRPSVGWWGRASYENNGGIPFTVTLAGGSRVVATEDQPYSPLESALSTVIFRRDYTDWYQTRSISIAAAIRPSRELTFTGSMESSRQTTAFAVDAFSLLRTGEAWRPNPLIDDGSYRTTTGTVTWDARNEEEHPGLTLFVRGRLRRVSSNNLTPVSLPTTIRDPLPVSGYGATDGELDVRAALRIDPEQRMNFRIAASGYIAGDPLTLQNRRAIGGANPLLGYDFRYLNCDRRRRVDVSLPALCDRTMTVQAEYHRTLPVDIGTQIAGQNIGIHNPDLVLLGEIGSAWLAGDAAGRVPSNRIQALREWRSDIGVGITSGPFGLYLSKAVADALPIRITFLLHARL